MTSEGPHDAGHDPTDAASNVRRGTASVPGTGRTEDRVTPADYPAPPYPAPPFATPPAASAPADLSAGWDSPRGPAQGDASGSMSFPGFAPPPEPGRASVPGGDVAGGFAPDRDFPPPPDRDFPPPVESFPGLRDNTGSGGFPQTPAGPGPHDPFGQADPGPHDPFGQAGGGFPQTPAGPGPQDQFGQTTGGFPAADNNSIAFPASGSSIGGYPPADRDFPPPSDFSPSDFSAPDRDFPPPADSFPGLRDNTGSGAFPGTESGYGSAPEPGFSPGTESGFGGFGGSQPGSDGSSSDLPSLPRRAPGQEDNLWGDAGLRDSEPDRFAEPAGLSGRASDSGSFPSSAEPAPAVPAPATIYPPVPTEPAEPFPGASGFGDGRTSPANSGPFGSAPPADRAPSSSLFGTPVPDEPHGSGGPYDVSFGADRPSSGAQVNQARHHPFDPADRSGPAAFDRGPAGGSPFDSPEPGWQPDPQPPQFGAASSFPAEPPGTPTTYGGPDPDRSGGDPSGGSGFAQPVPQQRPPAEPSGSDFAAAMGAPAVGRAVTASASVPMTSRATPPPDGSAPIPAAPSGSHSRVYGKPAGPDVEDGSIGVPPVGSPGDPVPPPAGLSAPAMPASPQAFGQPGVYPPPTGFPGGPEQANSAPPGVYQSPPPGMTGAPDGPADFRRPDEQDPYRGGSTYGEPAGGHPGSAPGPDQGRVYGAPSGPGGSGGPFGGQGAPAGAPGTLNGRTPGGPGGPGMGAPGMGAPGGLAAPGGPGMGGPSGPGMGGPGGPGMGGPSGPGMGGPSGPGMAGPGMGPSGMGGMGGPGMGAPGGPPPAGAWGPAPEQGRFDSFRPEEKAPPAAEPAEPPTPQIRNGRVLLAVLAGAALLLIVPFAIVWALTVGEDGPTFNVGSCVKQSGQEAVPAACGEAGAFEIVSKVAEVAKCPDPKQPTATLPDESGDNRVLCLKPVAAK